MTIAYFDCIAGASGDMILGALLDVGLDERVLQDQLACLNLPGFILETRAVSKQGFRATKVDVHVEDDVPARHLPDIETIVEKSDIAKPIKDKAMALFRRLGQVEATIHGTSLEQVHLHELGGVDTIVDIVGVLVGLDALGVEHVVVSPLPMGRGFVRGAHGQIPLPAPATVALLKDVPIVGCDIDKELVTPTGAVLLSSLADSFGSIPAMTLKAIGYGAGGRDLAIPNVLRIFLGHAMVPIDPPKPPAHSHAEEHQRSENLRHVPSPKREKYRSPPEVRGAISSHQTESPESDPLTETLILLETNIDDLNPEFYEYIMHCLFKAQALDVYLTPIYMKKSRPATQLNVLCRPETIAILSQIIFTETSTLGIRQHTILRHRLQREIKTVETPYGPVRIKVAYQGDQILKAAPEYEDCRRLAEEQGVALREVYQAAQRQISMPQR